MLSICGNGVLNHEEIKGNSDRLSNIKLFINKYKWKGISYPSEINDQKTFQKNSTEIPLNILYIKGKEICSACISKINSNCEKQVILLMIPFKEKEDWHYLVLKKLSALLKKITSKHDDFYRLNRLHSFRAENKLKSLEKVCKNKDFWWNCNAIRK